MQIQDDIKALQQYDFFARFVDLIHQFREECIEEMHKAPLEQIQQLSGRIISYDQILQMVDFDKIMKSHADALNR
tara:strand:- start:241 stop:465 length:225 start_codon:yes stop_codon:yes gene_type:complete